MNAIEYFSLILIILGAIIIHSYLYTVEAYVLPISFLFLGVFLVSLAVLFVLFPLIRGREISTNLSFMAVFIYILSLCVCYMVVTRFGMGAQGTDLRHEIQVAQNIYVNEHWDSGLETYSAYVSSLIVTIFPTILSKVTGIEIVGTFLLPMRLLAASTPIFVLVIVNFITKNRTVAFLSGLLFTLNYFFFTMAVNYMKTTFAIIFSLLLVYCLFHKGSKYKFLAMLFSIGIITSHYNTVYFTVYFLVSMLILSLFLYKIAPNKAKVILKQRFFTKTFLALFLVMIFMWQIFSSPVTFNTVTATVINFVTHMIDLDFGFKTIETSYVLSSPRGAIITGWFNFQNIIIGIGGLFALFSFFTGKMVKSKEVMWTLAGCSLLGLLSIWFVLPTLSVAVSPFRVVFISLAFFSYFFALIIRRVLNSRLLPFAVFFLILMLPLNMMLPAHQNDILYHPESALQPERVADSLISGHVSWQMQQVSQWVNLNVPKGKTVKADELGASTLELLLPFPRDKEVKRVSYPLFSYGDYILVEDFYIRNGLWIDSTYATGLIFKTDLNSTVLFNEPLNNVIYYSDRYVLLYFSEKTR